MKVNLLIGGYPLNGYLNIDPIAHQNDSSKVNHSLENLDSLIDNNECEEFIASKTIDVFPLNGRQQVLGHWLSKVEHNGIFIISGLDVNKAARMVLSGDINLNDLNTLLYGPCINMWSINKGVWSMDDVVKAILSNGQFRVLSKSFSGPYYVVKAQRL